MSCLIVLMILTIIMNEQGKTPQDFLDASKNSFSDNVDDEIKRRAYKLA